MRARKINAAKLATMPAPCKSCPFGPKGDASLRASVSRNLLQASQLCHSMGSDGKAIHGKVRPTRLCKGHRQLTCDILHGMGLLAEPTDQCFRETSARILNGGKR